MIGLKLGEQPVNVRLTLALLIEEPVDMPLVLLPLESVPNCRTESALSER